MSCSNSDNESFQKKLDASLETGTFFDELREHYANDPEALEQVNSFEKEYNVATNRDASTHAPIPRNNALFVSAHAGRFNFTVAPISGNGAAMVSGSGSFIGNPLPSFLGARGTCTMIIVGPSCTLNLRNNIGVQIAVFNGIGSHAGMDGTYLGDWA